MTEKNISPTCVDSYATLKVYYDFWGVVIDSKTLTIAFWASAERLFKPTALVKAIPVFWHFD